MFDLNHVATTSNEVADNLFAAIKECPFEKNKDVTSWNEASILYKEVLSHFLIVEEHGVNITGKSITIEDPIVDKNNQDVTSYLVVVLNVNVLSGRVKLTYKYPIDF